MTGKEQARARQKGGAIKSFLLFIGGLALLAAIALGVGGWLGYRQAVKPGPAREDVIVLLPQGSAVSTIAHQLEDEGVIEHPEIFIAAVRIKGVQSDIKAGEYNIPARSSVMEIIDQLREGKSILHYFTAPEGRTTAQIIRLLNENEVLEGEITIEPGEGELLPETFAFTRGETRDNLVRRMMKDQDALIDALWDDRALELPFSTPEEAIILASIVEKETGLPEERPRIAAVFVNRLKKGMRLESDPTIIYGLTQGEPLGRGLRLSELRKETPYNTYVIRGLPPTPIANPGEASIEAVLNPAETEDLFFVADGTGGHAFAATLREHNANVAAWRKVERERAAQERTTQGGK
ncbi:endolytic transglycosylase MltG [Hyphococcus sp.]|uniref:endolytic transglycosylase MltG n=1 Tax=Hyphococcus sp. TaxID=2038636 RepID=UPI0035C6DF18